uniref:GFA family protein n=1 Tax=Pseudomonas sp. MAG733B TaxID=3122079 RepID=UPI00403E3B7F
MHKGSCLCQRIQYELTAELGDFGYCHCISCGKASGSAHAANAPIGREHFRSTRTARKIRTASAFVLALLTGISTALTGFTCAVLTPNGRVRNQTRRGISTRVLHTPPSVTSSQAAASPPSIR